jgi:hypothetical protein
LGETEEWVTVGPRGRPSRVTNTTHVVSDDAPETMRGWGHRRASRDHGGHRGRQTVAVQDRTRNIGIGAVELGDVAEFARRGRGQNRRSRRNGGGRRGDSRGRVRNTDIADLGTDIGESVGRGSSYGYRRK